MKKYVNNKKYDTDTAKSLGTYESGSLPTDFGYLKETLYRKKTGEFFLYGEGGPLSKYGQKIHDGSGFGEGLQPISYEVAEKWAETHLSAEAYEEFFGIVQETDEKTTCTVYLSLDTYAKAKKIVAKEKYPSMGELLDELIRSRPEV